MSTEGACTAEDSIEQVIGIHISVDPHHTIELFYLIQIALVGQKASSRLSFFLRNDLHIQEGNVYILILAILVSWCNFCACLGYFYRIIVTVHLPPMSNHFHCLRLARKKKNNLENLHDTMTNQNILFNSVKILDYC